MKKIKRFLKYIWSVLSGTPINSSEQKQNDGPGGPLPTDPKGGGTR